VKWERCFTLPRLGMLGYVFCYRGFSFYIFVGCVAKCWQVCFRICEIMHFPWKTQLYFYGCDFHNKKNISSIWLQLSVVVIYIGICLILLSVTHIFLKYMFLSVDLVSLGMPFQESRTNGSSSGLFGLSRLSGVYAPFLSRTRSATDSVVQQTRSTS